MSSPIRYHSLDALRATMMLLGLVIHAAISYVTMPVEIWPFKDRNTTPLADFLVIVIHIFRMPVFFVMAGFFAALLRDRRGLRGLLANRVQRILIPFVLGWIILQPMVIYGFRFAVEQGNPDAKLTITPWINGSTLHLWFLYYLLIYYVVMALFVRVSRQTPVLNQTFSGYARRIIASPWRAVILAVPTMPLLLQMKMASFETSTSPFPHLKVLAGYFIFFSFGWLLYAQRDLLTRFQDYAWCHIIIGVVLMPMNLMAIGELSKTDDAAMLTLAATTGALIVWLLIFGWTGLFLKYFERPLPWFRYLTDASYWLYLVHLPLVLWLAGLLAPVDCPAELKLTAVLLVSLPILLASYHWLVRPTFIGRVLNGPRKA